MNGEMLSLESAAKLQRYEKAIKYIKEKIQSDEELYNANENNSFVQELAKTHKFALKEVLEILEVHNEN